MVTENEEWAFSPSLYHLASSGRNGVWKLEGNKVEIQWKDTKDEFTISGSKGNGKAAISPDTPNGKIKTSVHML